MTKCYLIWYFWQWQYCTIRSIRRTFQQTCTHPWLPGYPSVAATAFTGLHSIPSHCGLWAQTWNMHGNCSQGRWGKKCVLIRSMRVWGSRLGTDWLSCRNRQWLTLHNNPPYPWCFARNFPFLFFLVKFSFYLTLVSPASTTLLCVTVLSTHLHVWVVVHWSRRAVRHPGTCRSPFRSSEFNTTWRTHRQMCWKAPPKTPLWPNA